MPRVLFVCTGNICRSPTAEVLLRHRLEQEELTDWKVESAGTWTVEGRSASQHMIQLMAERGLDLTAHRSQTVDRRLMEQADLVLVMTRNHAEALRLEFPDQADKIYRLSEMRDGSGFDIADPYGGSPQEYQESVAELTELIEKGFDRIVQLAEENGSSA